MNKNIDFEIIDSHIHIFPKKPAEVVYKWVKKLGHDVEEIYEPSEIVNYLTDSGINKAFLLNFTHRPEKTKETNNWTSSLAEEYEPLIPFGTIHPKYEKAKEETERIFDLGFEGLKLHPPAQRFHPLNEKLFAIYEMFSEKGKPIIFHCGMFEEPEYHEYSHPELYEEIAEKFPKLKICLAHLCHFFTSELAEGRVPLVEEHENIYFDTSHWFSKSFQEVNNPPANHRDLVQVLKNYPDKFLFGTDFPTTGIEAKEQVENLLELEIDKNILKKLAGENAKKLISQK